MGNELICRLASIPFRLSAKTPDHEVATYEVSQAQILGIGCINLNLSKSHATLRFAYTTVQCILDQRTDDATGRTPGSCPERYEGLAARGGEEGEVVEVLFRSDPISIIISDVQAYGMEMMVRDANIIVGGEEVSPTSCISGFAHCEPAWLRKIEIEAGTRESIYWQPYMRFSEKVAISYRQCTRHDIEAKGGLVVSRTDFLA